MHKYGLEINRDLTTRSLEICKKNYENLKAHKFSQAQYQKINEVEIQIYNLYKKSTSQMDDFFDKKEGKDYERSGIPAVRYEKFWQDLPLSQEINNNWKDLRSKIKTEFMDIAMNLGVSFKFDDRNQYGTCEPCRKHYSSN